MRVPLPVRLLLLSALLIALSSLPAAAFDPAENDAFYLGVGLANMEVQSSTGLLAGSNLAGGLRLGLFWTVYGELGYGALYHSDTVDVAGTPTEINFRTTGAHLGLGFIVPIRAIKLGFSYRLSPSNRWAEETLDVTNPATPLTLSNVSGGVDYESYMVFSRFGQDGWFEAGIRRDQIKSTTSSLTNSFGPYFAFNIIQK